MTLDKLLTQFYIDNGIPENGGVDKDTFEMQVLGIKLTLPNPKFRKEVIHIHDIQHILNKCDTSWKGEAFIAGWELSTGFWKYLPICFFSFWAMGYSLWLYPKSVINGYKKGLNNIGIIDLNISESDFMKMEYTQLVDITSKSKHTDMGVLQWFLFLFWSLVSQLVFLFPLILIVFTILWLNN